ncbi:hypothetical protein ZHS_91 [Edwardsiella phage vB_EpM_ZHS]|nr:hypothetical protein ZHS_91 [Edwardsiella phage vB_EpM_ZHS]
MAHPKPMRRHTKHVVPAEFEYTIRLPGAGGPSPGLHLELKFDDGATQRIIFPLGPSLEKLVQGSRMASTLQKAAESQEFGISPTHARRLAADLCYFAKVAENDKSDQHVRLGTDEEDKSLFYLVIQPESKE